MKHIQNNPGPRLIAAAGILLICCFIQAPLDLFAQRSTEGIAFSRSRWTLVLKQAKQEGKLVFVDLYTTWCVPCKKMEKEIFSLKEVGLKYNANFINYRADAERGWGLEIKEKYNVDAYPTFLFVNGDGQLVYTAKGYNPDPSAFLELADIALQRFKSQLSVNSSN